MLKATEFVSVQAQASIFTPGLNLHTSRVLKRLLDRYAEVFDGDPITVPVPEGFPDAPRLVLQNRDGNLRLQVAPSRLDVMQSADDLDATRPLPDFLRWCVDLFDAYLDVTRGRVGRLASVVHRRANPAEPAREIAAHFCRTDLLEEGHPFDRPSDFEIHAAKRFCFFDELEINSWLRCKTAMLLGSKQPIIVVEQDFNTLTEKLETAEFNSDQRREFFNRVPAGFQEVMNLYFPPRK